jgi:hypothetical protein
VSTREEFSSEFASAISRPGHAIIWQGSGIGFVWREALESPGGSSAKQETGRLWRCLRNAFHQPIRILPPRMVFKIPATGRWTVTSPIQRSSYPDHTIAIAQSPQER